MKKYNNWLSFTYYCKSKKYSSYGLYSDNSISYGIGYPAVIRCLKCFKNVKITSEYFGINESNIKIEFYSIGVDEK